MDNVERGKQIRRRRMGLGIGSVSELALRTGLARSTVSKAEHGDASAGTYRQLDAWLSERERSGEDPPPLEPEPVQLEQIEFTVEGDFGVKVTVKGPITDRAALEDSVAKIIRSIRDTTPPPE